MMILRRRAIANLNRKPATISPSAATRDILTRSDTADAFAPPALLAEAPAWSMGSASPADALTTEAGWTDSVGAASVGAVVGSATESCAGVIGDVNGSGHTPGVTDVGASPGAVAGLSNGTELVVAAWDVFCAADC